MPIPTSTLPVTTRLHLFRLITNPGYYRDASKAPYGAIPVEGMTEQQRAPVSSVKKFGYDQHLPAGAAERVGVFAGIDPGLWRLVSYCDPSNRTTWWRARHRGSNSYGFEMIVVPACRACGGTTEKVCARCHGSGRQEKSDTVFPGPCTQCDMIGFSACATCAPPVVVDGKAISRIQNDWG